jgi:zeta-carotene desaturase
MHRFWWLVIASALNSELNQISVVYAFKVIRELFLNSAWAGAMGMSRVPLSELYSGAEQYLQAHGGEIRFQEHVEGASWDSEAGVWRVATRNGEFLSRHMVLALPFEGLAKLMPGMPTGAGVTQLAEQVSRHNHWPISSVHLWFDRQITELDHAVLLDRDIHWMYHKSRWQTGRSAEGSYVELVVSVSREFAALSREAAIERAVGQLAEYFPVVRQAKLVKCALTKDVRATFGVPPGVDGYRPGAVSPWPNCYLAGDWVATGWPSTMESACRSGVLAAEAVCRAVGRPKAILPAELKPTGLMRLLS